jgi:hypothetical protein
MTNKIELEKAINDLAVAYYEFTNMEEKFQLQYIERCLHSTIQNEPSLEQLVKESELKSTFFRLIQEKRHLLENERLGKNKNIFITMAKYYASKNEIDALNFIHQKLVTLKYNNNINISLSQCDLVLARTEFHFLNETLKTYIYALQQYNSKKYMELDEKDKTEISIHKDRVSECEKVVKRLVYIKSSSNISVINCDENRIKLREDFEAFLNSE